MSRWLLIIIPVALLGGLIAWRLHTKKVEAATQAQQRKARIKSPPVVSVAPVEVRDIVRRYETIGTVESPFNVKLAAKVTGRIDYLMAREGDKVSRGQVLVRIDPAEIEAEVRQRTADVNEARAKLTQAVIGETPADISVNTQIRQQAA